MANSDVPSLTTIGTISADDYVYIIDDPAGTPLDRKGTAGDLRQFMLAAFGGQTNAITGTATAVISTLNVCSGTTSDYTVTLPAASGNANKFIGFRMDAGLTKFVTLDGNSTETIDGATTRIMWAGETAILYCDGSNWFKIAGTSIPMSASIYLSGGDQTGVVTSTITKINVNTSASDPTGVMVNTGSKRLDIKRGSAYHISASIVWSNLSANSPRTLTKILISNVEVYQAESFGASGGYPGVSLSVSGSVLLAGDYVEIWGYQNTGVNQQVWGSGQIQTYIAVSEICKW